MKIRYKLLMGYVLVALLVAIVAGIARRGMETTRQVVMIIAEETIPIIETLGDLRYAGLRIVASTSEFGLLTAERLAHNAPESAPGAYQLAG